MHERVDDLAEAHGIGRRVLQVAEPVDQYMPSPGALDERHRSSSPVDGDELLVSFGGTVCPTPPIGNGPAGHRAGTQLLSTQPDSTLAAKTGESVIASPGTHGLRIGRPMTKANGRLATAIVQRYRERFGRGPSLAKAHIGTDFAVVVLGDVQTEVEQSLVAEGEVESVELLRSPDTPDGRRRILRNDRSGRSRKVVAMLGDHNAVANSSVLVFLLEPDRP